MTATLDDLKQAARSLSEEDRFNLAVSLVSGHENASHRVQALDLLNRIRVYGIDEVAKQEGVKPHAIYQRLYRADVHLRARTRDRPHGQRTGQARPRLNPEQRRARAVDLVERCRRDGPAVVASQEGRSIRWLRDRLRNDGFRMPWKDEQAESITTEQGAA